MNLPRRRIGRGLFRKREIGKAASFFGDVDLRRLENGSPAFFGVLPQPPDVLVPLKSNNVVPFLDQVLERDQS